MEEWMSICKPLWSLGGLFFLINFKLEEEEGARWLQIATYLTGIGVSWTCWAQVPIFLKCLGQQVIACVTMRNSDG